MIVKIVDKNEPVLREKAKVIPISEIKSEKIQKIIQNMKDALDTQEDGVAIAAPQIAENLRMFVISEKILQEYSRKTGKKTETDKIVFINPEIVFSSKRKEFMEEGCLSVRYLYGKVKRSIKATIKAYDENGENFERTATGLLAQIFQHEVDHLNGILFIDNAIDVVDMPPKK